MKLDSQTCPARAQGDTSEPAVLLVGGAALALDADVSTLALSLIEILNLGCRSGQLSDAAVPLYRLSRLLWAATGMHGPGAVGSAPAWAAQHIALFVITQHGWYRYDPDAPALRLCGPADLRASSAGPAGARAAPLHLAYVAMLDAAPGTDPAEALLCAAIQTGQLSQNVALLCAADGMACESHPAVADTGLASALGLQRQRALLVQTLGCLA